MAQTAKPPRSYHNQIRTLQAYVATFEKDDRMSDDQKRQLVEHVNGMTRILSSVPLIVREGNA